MIQHHSMCHAAAMMRQWRKSLISVRHLNFISMYLQQPDGTLAAMHALGDRLCWSTGPPWGYERTDGGAPSLRLFCRQQVTTAKKRITLSLSTAGDNNELLKGR
jgi:hypothetical protein